MARPLVIPPKTTLVVGMPPALFRALLLSKLALQKECSGLSVGPNPDDDSISAQAVRAVNLVLGLPDDYGLSRKRLLDMAESC